MHINIQSVQEAKRGGDRRVTENRIHGFSNACTADRQYTKLYPNPSTFSHTQHLSRAHIHYTEVSFEFQHYDSLKTRENQIDSLGGGKRL